jgi:hypothetical protein
MILEKAEIYPVKIYHGNVLEDPSFEEKDIHVLQDVIENLSPDTHSNLQKVQSRPAFTDTGLFLNNVEALNKVKEIFYDCCITLHEDKFPQFKGKLKVYDSIARGLVVNHNTTVQDTMSNHPWSYTGILVCRVPDNLPAGQGDMVFIDPLPATDHNDQFGITSKKGNLAIFPGWLKYRFRPIQYEQGIYDTVMFLVMNAMVVHTTTEEHLKTEIEKSRNSIFKDPHSEQVDDLMQLGPSPSNPGEIDIGDF